jgi:hypothetical protein
VLPWGFSKGADRATGKGELQVAFEPNPPKLSFVQAAYLSWEDGFSGNH